jgi:hypothetical protein
MTKKTIDRAESDTGLILIAYNLRRIINIIGFKTLLKYLMERGKFKFFDNYPKQSYFKQI